jgi:hypothetical protein
VPRDELLAVLSPRWIGFSENDANAAAKGARWSQSIGRIRKRVEDNAFHLGRIVFS